LLHKKARTGNHKKETYPRKKGPFLRWGELAS